MAIDSTYRADLERVELVVLFSGASRNSARVLVPLNVSALNAGRVDAAFYCVHSLSGTVSDYSPLMRELGTDVPVFGVQLPPNRIHDPGFVSSIEKIAAHYVEAIVAFQPSGPLAVGGWSVGATIALEMAQQLRALGREVTLLVAIADVLPNTDAGISLWNPMFYLILLRNLVRRSLHDDLLRRGSLHLFVKRYASRLIAWTKVAIASLRGDRAGRSHAVDGFMDASRFSPEHMDFMRALFIAGDQYVPSYYPGRVVAYAATVPPVFTLNRVEKVWAKTASQAEIVRIKALHENLVNMPQVIPLARHLRTRLLDAFQQPSDSTLEERTGITA